MGPMKFNPVKTCLLATDRSLCKGVDHGLNLFWPKRTRFTVHTSFRIHAGRNWLDTIDALRRPHSTVKELNEAQCAMRS